MSSATAAVLRVEPGGREGAAEWAAGILRAGGLVVLPTDTVYGVAAHPARREAVARLYEIKGRDPDKPIALLAAALDDVDALGADWGDAGRELAARFWPGPLTLVLKTAQAWEGFRVPDCDLARAVLRASGGLLRVTSANRSGEPESVCDGEALRCLGDRVEGVLAAGRAPGGTPSTVVRIEGSRTVLLREGALPGKLCLNR